MNNKQKLKPYCGLIQGYLKGILELAYNDKIKEIIIKMIKEGVR